MVSDQARRDPYEVLDQQLGQSQAGTLMELLPPVGWAVVARQSDLVAVRGERAQMRGEMGEIRGEIAKLSARIDGQIPRFLWANVPLVTGVAGLVLAAATLA